MFIVYGKSNCVFCTKAIELLLLKDLPYLYLDVSVQDNLKKFKEIFVGINQVPQITYNDMYIGGYTDLERYITDLPDKN